MNEHSWNKKNSEELFKNFFNMYSSSSSYPRVAFQSQHVKIKWHIVKIILKIPYIQGCRKYHRCFCGARQASEWINFFIKNKKPQNELKNSGKGFLLWNQNFWLWFLLILRLGESCRSVRGAPHTCLEASSTRGKKKKFCSWQQHDSGGCSATILSHPLRGHRLVLLSHQFENRWRRSVISKYKYLGLK